MLTCKSKYSVFSQYKHKKLNNVVTLSVCCTVRWNILAKKRKKYIVTSIFYSLQDTLRKNIFSYEPRKPEKVIWATPHFLQNTFAVAM